MNKKGDKTYKAKSFQEQLAIGTKTDREWLKKQTCRRKSESPKSQRQHMIRRWRRGIKQTLHKLIYQTEE